MSKAATSLIQTGLRDAGFSPGVIDGFYGPKTANAAQAWLLRGRIGPDTAVALIQSGLRDLGYAPGAIDGRFGPKTNSAAQAWLMARGVSARAVLLPTTSSMIYQGSARYPVEEICVHTSATLPDWMEASSIQAQRAEIRRWHVSPKPIGEGWNDIGYHHLVFRKGATIAGRAETVIGAGVRNHNQGVIHTLTLTIRLPGTEPRWALRAATPEGESRSTVTAAMMPPTTQLRSGWPGARSVAGMPGRMAAAAIGIFTASPAPAIPRSHSDISGQTASILPMARRSETPSTA
ncbi:peptidoglycan-binding protein [Pseudogemmobacter bohemicus]|uniref:peptidoglycan-binding protein n=1 Tax=Pseudogemmobacter bohemicus TaxID=2250708 RepID=UPI001300189D|nr:peptidoglycan-binding protein [Pseudogemmobacter bohemicus]